MDLAIGIEDSSAGGEKAPLPPGKLMTKLGLDGLSELHDYEVLWSGISPDGKELEPEVAVKFFKKSGLPIKVLRTIWEEFELIIMEEADCEEPLGSLDREAFFVACKLIALVQAGEAPDIDNFVIKTAVPDFNAAKQKMKRTERAGQMKPKWRERDIMGKSGK